MSHFGALLLEGILYKGSGSLSTKWQKPKDLSQRSGPFLVIVHVQDFLDFLANLYITHHAKGSSANFLKNVVVIVYAVLCFDLDRLRDVLGVDVEHKLVVVPDLALLATDFLASFRIN